MKTRHSHITIENALDTTLDPQNRALRRLYAAVLTQGIYDYISAISARPPYPQLSVEDYKAYRRTQSWFSSHETRPMSFVWLCDVLNLDADTVRGAVVRRRKELAATPIYKLAAKSKIDDAVCAEEV